MAARQPAPPVPAAERVRRPPVFPTLQPSNRVPVKPGRPSLARPAAEVPAGKRARHPVLLVTPSVAQPAVLAAAAAAATAPAVVAAVAGRPRLFDPDGNITGVAAGGGGGGGSSFVEHGAEDVSIVQGVHSGVARLSISY